MTREFPLQMVRERSKSFQVPYENMLIACSKERILKHFLEDHSQELDDVVAFYGMTQFGIEQYRHSKEATLEVKVLLDELSEDCLERIWNSFVSEEAGFEGRWLFTGEEKAELEVKVAYDKLSLPILVKFEASKARKGLLQTWTLQLTYENDERISVPCFFPEAEVAMRFLEVWDKMELLQDVSLFECIYNLSKAFTMDGRRISQYLSECFEENGWDYDAERKDLVLACKDSTHLKKRWKSYLSKEKRREPSWETVMEVFVNLYEPILEKMENEEIFFGDWMPVVGRYL